MPWHPNVRSTSGAPITHTWLGKESHFDPNQERAGLLERRGTGPAGRPEWVLFRQGPKRVTPHQYEEDGRGFIRMQFRMFGGGSTATWACVHYNPTSGKAYVSDVNQRPLLPGSGGASTQEAGARELARYRLPTAVIMVQHPELSAEDAVRRAAEQLAAGNNAPTPAVPDESRLTPLQIQMIPVRK